MLLFNRFFYEGVKTDKVFFRKKIDAMTIHINYQLTITYQYTTQIA